MDEARPDRVHSTRNVARTGIEYSVLHPERLEAVFEQVEESLPDLLRNKHTFAAMCDARSTLIFEVGNFQGVFWLSDIVIGQRATIHIVLWGTDVKKKHSRAKDILRSLFTLLKLRRMQAYIPTRMTWACEYSEAMGFTLEGVLRKFERYDNELQDVAVYAVLKEDL